MALVILLSGYIINSAPVGTPQPRLGCENHGYNPQCCTICSPGYVMTTSSGNNPDYYKAFETELTVDTLMKIRQALDLSGERKELEIKLVDIFMHTGWAQNAMYRTSWWLSEACGYCIPESECDGMISAYHHSCVPLKLADYEWY